MGDLNAHCKSCQKVISAKATRCPYCWEDLRDWPNRHPILFCLGLLFIMLVVLVKVLAWAAPREDIASDTSRNFQVGVSFDGTQFTIINVDTDQCQNMKMEINGGILSGGYRLEGYTLDVGATYTVGAGQFTDSNGERLNPFTTKPQTASIYCRGDNTLKNAFWYGEFK